ncbi:MAG: hypothetical protein WDZ46_04150 [Solirubrobacterales bacterium]
MAAQTEIRELVHREGEYSFLLAEPGRERRVRFWGDVPAPAAPRAEPALAATLLIAMAECDDLSLPVPLSRQLCRTLPDIQAVLRTLTAASVATDRVLRPVGLHTPPGPPPRDVAREEADAARAGVFFSAGVDSWSALLDNPDVTDLIYVHGFDIAVDRMDASAPVEKIVAATAERLGLRRHIIRTNLRAVLDPAVPWEIGHGPGLVSAALLMAPLCARVVIGAGMTYGTLFDRGSHPLHDYLWSTEECRVEHHGAHLTRAAKVAQIAADEDVLRILRVCWADPASYNCGRCEKCVRTMAALEIAGELDRCPTFEPPLELDRIRALRFSDDDLLVLWRENLAFARERGAAPDLTAAIEECVAINEERLAAAQAQ